MRDRVSAVKVSMRGLAESFNGRHAASVSAEVQKVSMRDRASAVYIVSAVWV
jgi:hypothetical protein